MTHFAERRTFACHRSVRAEQHGAPTDLRQVLHRMAERADDLSITIDRAFAAGRECALEEAQLSDTKRLYRETLEALTGQPTNEILEMIA